MLRLRRTVSYPDHDDRLTCGKAHSVEHVAQVCVNNLRTRLFEKPLLTIALEHDPAYLQVVLGL